LIAPRLGIIAEPGMFLKRHIIQFDEGDASDCTMAIA
jgi:hypothetical protein